MYEILELLYDYSIKNKKVDRKFIDRVLSFYWNGLKNYLENVEYCSIIQPKNFPDSYIPAQYRYFDKRLLIDEKVIDNSFSHRMLTFQML